MLIRPIVYTFIGFLFTLSGYSAQALTLEEVVSEVIKTHPAITQADWAAKEAKHQKKAQSWLPDPTVGVMFEEVGANNSSLGNAQMTNYFISQEIPFPGTLVTRSKAFEALHQSRLSLKESVLREKVFEAKKTYYDLVAIRNLIRVNLEVTKSYRQLEAAFEERYRAAPGDQRPQSLQGMGGRSILGDVLSSRMQKEMSQADIFDLTQQKQGLQSKLNLLMGRNPKASLDKLKTPRLERIKLKLSVLEDKLKEQNSDLQALSWVIEQSKKEVTLAKEKLIPTLEPQFIYNQRQNMENAYSLGIGLNLPLWINKNHAEIKAAQANAFRSKAAYESQKLRLREILHEMYERLLEQFKIVKKYENEIVPLARSAYRVTESAYQAMESDSEELLQKLIRYNEASHSYWNVWRNYQTTLALLEQLVGENF